MVEGSGAHSHCMPAPVGLSSLLPVAFSQFAVGTFADVVGKACRVVLSRFSIGAARGDERAGRGRPSRTAVLLVAPAACSKKPGTVERKSESTTQTSQGEVKTTTQSKQVGNTLEAKTETATDTGAGTVKGEVETYVGTVTIYEPGKKIEVMTSDNKPRRVTVKIEG
jgi:hypothetical protein